MVDDTDTDKVSEVVLIGEFGEDVVVSGESVVNNVFVLEFPIKLIPTLLKLEIVLELFN